MDDLIRRQDAIDEIKALYEWHDTVTEDRVVDHLKRLPSSQQWIPCSERLPSDYGLDWVLAQIQEDNRYLWIPQVMEYRKADDDWYSNNKLLVWLKDHNGSFKVIAWMPLPEPYEKKE